MVAIARLCHILDRGADVVTFTTRAEVHAHRLVHLIRDSGAQAGISLCPGLCSVLEDLIEDMIWCLSRPDNPEALVVGFIPHSN